MSRSTRNPVLWRIAILAGMTLGLLPRGSIAADDDDGPCTRTAEYAHVSCRYEAYDDYYRDLGKCENESDPADALSCKKEARATLKEALALCGEQSDAREDLCDEIGEGPYDPAVDPANFVKAISNRYLPLVPGTTRVYEANTEEGLERIEVTATRETREILGVLCTVVRDTVYLNDEVIEDTVDWFAQDKTGNVWYFGERSVEYEAGMIASLDGSWEAGVDGAKAGIVMKAKPRLGAPYRQEFALGDAEDLGQIIALNQTVSVVSGTFSGCVQTKDFTPIEPGAFEHKFYAPGVGSVLVVNVESGKRTELIGVFKE